MPIIPAPGFLLLEKVPVPHTSKLARSNEDTADSNYGKVLDWGLPLLQEGGVVLQVPRFAIDTNEEGLGGKERKLRKGDIVVFEKRTERKMNDDYSSGPEIAQIRFDSVLALYLLDEEVKK